MQLSAVLIVKDVSTRPHTEIIPETFIQMQNQECWKNVKLELVNAKIYIAPSGQFLCHEGIMVIAQFTS